MRTTTLISGLALTLATILGAGQAFAGHDRKVVVRETVYSSPAVVYHSGSSSRREPSVSVYYGPTHTTRVITTTSTVSRHYSSGHNSRIYGHVPPVHLSAGKVYGHHHHGHRHGYRHQGYQHQSYRSSAPTRGSWSRDRREVIHVNRNARKSSNYHRVERNSVVIRERRR